MFPVTSTFHMWYSSVSEYMTDFLRGTRKPIKGYLARFYFKSSKSSPSQTRITSTGTVSGIKIQLLLRRSDVQFHPHTSQRKPSSISLKIDKCYLCYSPSCCKATHILLLPFMQAADSIISSEFCRIKLEGKKIWRINAFTSHIWTINYC